MAYDSTEETLKHISDVRYNISRFCALMIDRGTVHDESKLSGIEKEIFDEWTPKLSEVEYGTEEYKEMLKNIKPAIDNHYKKNTHHPEHYENGIEGMDLFDIVEMFCDWQAAVKRSKNGDILKSIEYNKKRFNMSDQLASIFINTIKNHTGD